MTSLKNIQKILEINNNSFSTNKFFHQQKNEATTKKTTKKVYAWQAMCIKIKDKVHVETLKLCLNYIYLKNIYSYFEEHKTL